MSGSRTPADRLQDFDGRLRAELDAWARDGAGYSGRRVWRGLRSFRSRLSQLQIDPETAERAVAELARRLGIVHQLPQDAAEVAA